MSMTLWRVHLSNTVTNTDEQPTDHRFFLGAIWHLIKAWYNYKANGTNWWTNYSIERVLLG